LIALADAETTGTIANDIDAMDAGASTKLVKSDKQSSAYFWSIGICLGGDDNHYLVFTKGAQYDPADYTAHDEIHLLRVGATWSDTANAANFIISDADLNDTGNPDDGFAINGVAVTVFGGDTLQMKTAHNPIQPTQLKAMQVKAEEELNNK
jgi:hypothetical protein